MYGSLKVLPIKRHLGTEGIHFIGLVDLPTPLRWPDFFWPYLTLFHLRRPHFYFFLEQNCISKPNFRRFLKIFSSSDTKLSEINSGDPLFQVKKIHSRDPTLKTRAAHRPYLPTQFFFLVPLPGILGLFGNVKCLNFWYQSVRKCLKFSMICRK